MRHHAMAKGCPTSVQVAVVFTSAGGRANSLGRMLRASGVELHRYAAALLS